MRHNDDGALKNRPTRTNRTDAQTDGPLARLLARLKQVLGSDGPTADMPAADAFGVLSNARRCYVIQHLAGLDDDATVELGELAEVVAVREHADKTTTTAITGTERKRAYVSLYQTHLPQLDDVGAVAFDSDRGTIQATPATHALDRLFDHAHDIVGTDGGSA